MGCEGCKQFLGGEYCYCRIGLERECGDGGHELYERRELSELLEGVTAAI